MARCLCLCFHPLIRSCIRNWTNQTHPRFPRSRGATGRTRSLLGSKGEGRGPSLACALRHLRCGYGGPSSRTSGIPSHTAVPLVRRARKSTPFQPGGSAENGRATSHRARRSRTACTFEHLRGIIKEQREQIGGGMAHQNSERCVPCACACVMKIATATRFTGQGI